jgi:hypothetical protein
LELIKDNITLSGQKCASDVLITHNIGRKFWKPLTYSFLISYQF